MEAAMACMKYILFAFNFLLWVLGAALLSIGIWVRTDSDLWEFQSNLRLTNYYDACYLIIAVGVILLIIGFLGCCGAATESPCMLLMYFICMLILLMCELAAVGLVWKIADGDKLQKALSEEILHHIQLRPEYPSSDRFLSILQLKLQCCGAYTFKDYEKENQETPPSCNSDRTNNINFRSCGENLRRYLEKRGAAIGGICLGVALLQLIALVFSLCLFCAIRQESKEGFKA